jgi:2'-5' RNA ligase
MSTVRTFVAIAASADTRARAAELSEVLRTCGMRVTWTRPENLHLTLKFLGDVDEARVPVVCRSVTAAVAAVPAFTARFAGAGAFPDIRRPQTLWVGTTLGHDELCRLAAAVEQALQEVGFAPEQRTFKPHLTLGRVRTGGRAQQRELSQLLAECSQFDCDTTRVCEVVVLSSQLSPSGPAYQPLGRGPLAS